MTAISSPDLVLLRSEPDTHKTIERLYTPGFPSVWTGRVNGTHGRGAQTVTYDGGATNVAAGFSFTAVRADMELWFGSSAGAKDRGTARMISKPSSASAGTVVIEWNDLQLSDNDHITAVQFFAPKPRFSWFTVTGPDFRKDGPPSSLGGGGLDYSDQNEQPPPQVIMGDNYAGKIPASGSLVIQLDASNSVALAAGASISTFSWAVEPGGGATLSSSSVASPTLTVTTNGTRWVHCTVTDDNGKTTIGHRCYIIGNGITEFERSEISTRFGSPEVRCNISSTSPDTSVTTAIRPQVDWSNFETGAIVIITAEDYYGSTQKTITSRGEFASYQHIVFSGYIQSETADIVTNAAGQVSLDCATVVPMFLYSLSLTGVGNPSDWYEMTPDLMTVAGNLFHLFKYQSTLLDLADFWLPWSDTVRRSANEEFTEGGLMERAIAFARSRYMAITGTPQGEIVVQQDINLLSSAARAAVTTTMTLTTADVTGARPRARQRDDIVRVFVSGGSSQGVIGSFTPILAANANVASSRAQPSPISVDRLSLIDAAEARRVAARLGAVANARYYEIDFDTSGNYRMVFDPAWQQWTGLGTVISANALRGDTAAASLNCVPRQVTLSRPANGVVTLSVVADIEAPEGLDGVDLPIPTVPSTDPADNDYDPPGPVTWPPIPDAELIAGYAVVVDDNDGVYLTPDSGANWAVRNGALATVTGGTHLFWDPWWKTVHLNNTSNPEKVVLWWAGLGFIYRSIDAGASWVDITYQLGNPPNTHGDSPAPTLADITFVQGHGSINHFGHTWFTVYWQTGGNNRGWLVATTDNGFSWSWSSI